MKGSVGDRVRFNFLGYERRESGEGGWSVPGYLNVYEEITNLENDLQADHGFKIENCRAKHRTADLVDCHSPQQAHLCGASLPFGNGFFCRHASVREIIEATKKMQNETSHLSDASQSVDQE
jgi:hypothetical protein